MIFNYVLKDEKGISGQQIQLVQGETKTVQVFLFNLDGSPLVFVPTVSELVAKIYTSISTGSIVKKLSLTTVTLINSTALGGMIGFEFTIAASETVQMQANSSGLPMLAIITDSTGAVSELNFQSAFTVVGPAVVT